eukprot:1193970-Prorocentrum_minimum.AAC.1
MFSRRTNRSVQEARLYSHFWSFWGSNFGHSSTAPVSRPAQEVLARLGADPSHPLAGPATACLANMCLGDEEEEGGGEDGADRLAAIHEHGDLPRVRSRACAAKRAIARESGRACALGERRGRRRSNVFGVAPRCCPKGTTGGRRAGVRGEVCGWPSGGARV